MHERTKDQLNEELEALRKRVQELEGREEMLGALVNNGKHAGGPADLETVIQYIAEQKRLEEKLEYNTILLSEVRRLAHLGNWEWRITENIVIWSDELYRIYGLDETSFKASFEGYLERVHPEDREHAMTVIQGALATGEPFEFEERIVRPDGESRHLKSWGGIVKNEQGEAVSMFGACLDITEMKRAESKIQRLNEDLEIKVRQRTAELQKAREELEQALLVEKEMSELKSNFVSTASHQFRTPLTVIRSNIELLMMKESDLSTDLRRIFSKATNRIQWEVDRMTEMLDEILVLSRINAGHQPIRRSQTDMVSLAEQVISRSNMIQVDGRQISLEIKGEAKKLRVDRSQIANALANLISNAFKYSPGSPEPRLILDFGEHNLFITVQDYGIGIPPGDIKNMFQPFFRSSNSADFPGTGLGIAIVREYVEMNDGHVNLESVLGEGTTVTITLPIYGTDHEEE